MLFVTGEIGDKQYADEALVTLKELEAQLVKSKSLPPDFFNHKKATYPFKVVFEEKDGRLNEPTLNIPLATTIQLASGDTVSIRYSSSTRRRDENGNWKYAQNKKIIRKGETVADKELAFFLMIHSQQESSPVRVPTVAASFYYHNAEKVESQKAQVVKMKYLAFEKIKEEDEETLREKYLGMGYNFVPDQSIDSIRDTLLVELERVGATKFFERYDKKTNFVGGIYAKALHYHILEMRDNNTNSALYWGSKASSHLQENNGGLILQVPKSEDFAFAAKQYFIDRQSDVFATLSNEVKAIETDKKLDVIIETHNKVETIVKVDVKKMNTVVEFAIANDLIFLNKIDKKVHLTLGDNTSVLLEYNPKDTKETTIGIIAAHLKEKPNEKIGAELINHVKQLALQTSPDKK
jgi:hypothetical protein